MMGGEYPDEKFCKSIHCEVYQNIEKLRMYQGISDSSEVYENLEERIVEERKKCDICRAKKYKDFLERNV